MPVPPWSATGIPVASTMSVTRWLSRVGVAAYVPWALPIAGANTSTPVAVTNSTTVSSDWTSAASSPVISSVRLKPSISPSTSAPWRAGLGDDLDALAGFSSTDSFEASNRTEFQPSARHWLITARSGQWSRWSATGTVMSFVSARHIAIITSAPVSWTCLTEVWTITGARSSSAASSTACIVRSLTTLIAATP